MRSIRLGWDSCQEEKERFHQNIQKLLPAATLAAFLLGSLFYVIFVFNPTIDLSINGRPSMKVRSRSEAEIEVYRELPYKATFQLSTGQHFSVDMRFLGLSYFTEEELKRLDNISAKTVWDKFTPFFDTKENLQISIYPNRLFWLRPFKRCLSCPSWCSQSASNDQSPGHGRRV